MVEADFKEYSDKKITFFYQKTLPFENLQGKSIDWIANIVTTFGKELSSLNYILCTDEQLHKINLKHLKHDNYTDIITFDYSEDEETIESDIYISLDRIKENADALGKTFDDELHRVMIHGVLHLIGYNDKAAKEQKEMREKENTCLSLR